MAEQRSLQLAQNQYCWIQDNSTGKTRTEVGPQMVILSPTEEFKTSGAISFELLTSNDYLVIRNPYDEATGTYSMGKFKVVEGPATFPKHRFEGFETKKRKYVLGSTQAMVLKAKADHTDQSGTVRRAGECWLVKGECTVVPMIGQAVKQGPTEAITVLQNEGIYIINTKKQEVRLVEGPKTVFLDVDEKLWPKSLNQAEREAIFEDSNPRYLEHPYGTYRVMKASKLSSDQVMCVVDYADDSEKYIMGPCNYMLKPHEGIKVLVISGHTPKQERVLPISKVKLGPGFSSDQFQVRTKDNVEITMTVQYKWMFVVPRKNVGGDVISEASEATTREVSCTRKLFDKMFAGDFIGYACQSMCSRVRGLASQVDYEVFVKDTGRFLKDGLKESPTPIKGLFKDHTLFMDDARTKPLFPDPNDPRKAKVLHGRFYPEYSIMIQEIDVKMAEASDGTIKKLLREAQNTNQMIAMKMDKATETMRTEVTTLDAAIDFAKAELETIRAKNRTYEQKERAKVALEVESLGAATANTVAKMELERAKQERELEAMAATIKMLESPAAGNYIDFVRLEALKNGSVENMLVVPADMPGLKLVNN